jgi:uncharacterized protein
MDFGLPPGRHERICNAIRLFPSIDSVIIFGSRALGTCRPASDLDLAVFGENITFTDILRLRIVLDELPYGYTYDVLDYSKISSPELREHIDQHGLPFYKKKAIQGV